MNCLLSSLYIPCHIHREYLIRRTSAVSDIKSYKYKGISIGYWCVLVRVGKGEGARQRGGGGVGIDQPRSQVLPPP